MFGEDYVELRGWHHIVLVRSLRHVEHWLRQGFTEVPEEQTFFAIAKAFDSSMPRGHSIAVWKRLFPRPPPPAWWFPNFAIAELARETRGSMPQLYVLERAIEHGVWRDVPKLERPALPSRTATEHYVVIEAVTDAEPPAPVPGLRLELLIAGGEVKTAQTDSSGIARLERIQAGRVVIRVLDLDGALWKPSEGAPSEPSGSNERRRIHVASQGDCLSRIAHQYGLKSWEQIWNDPNNERLRKKRKNPNVLLPGDEVAVPAVAVHEITRPTDATHRLIVDKKAEVELELILEGMPAEPLAGHSCVLRYEGAQGPATLESLKLDQEGRLRVKLPIQVRAVQLEISELDEKLSLQLGELDPVANGETGEAELSGVQQRLSALGYGAPPTGRLDDVTRVALAAFQRFELGRSDATGEADAASCAKLEELYRA